MTEKRWPKLKEQIQKAIAAQDYDEFYRLTGQATPRQMSEFEEADAVAMLWTVSVTWGFEVAWFAEHQIPPEERHLDDLPGIEELTPDLPLSKHALWAPQDHMGRVQR